MNRELLLSIFRDAHVVDVDMSSWDRCIRLAVVALESTAFPAKRLPVYVVEFQGVTELVVSFHHHGRPADFGHYQWNADTIVLDEDGDRFRLQLSGSQLMPVTEIVFAAVEIRALDNSKLDRRFPGWSKPGAPMVRAGVEEELEQHEPKR
jgi:hypothetical protein